MDLLAVFLRSRNDEIHNENLQRTVVGYPGRVVSHGADKPNQSLHSRSSEASPTLTNPYPDKPHITFRSDGTFKITVFSDMHWGENPWDAWGPEQDANSTRLMEKVLPSEKPDFVVLNGDLITGENAFKDNATLLIDRIVAPLNAAQIPFCSTQGNHDNQKNITHLQEILREQQVAPLSYTRVAPPGVGGAEGPGNYWIPVFETSTDFAPVLVLWFFDSRGGFSYGDNSTAVPDWVDESVATWIENESNAMNDAWGPPENRAALAFVHIPPHLIQGLQAELNSTKEPGLNADSLGSGSTQSTTDEANLGKDDAFWNSLNANVKNLHAVISGHDHGNEWCIREPSKDVIFCFDKHAGYGGYGEPSWGYGVRNLVFSSTDPNAGVQTWIRLEDGDTRATITLDKNYA
ncbi:Metallo-dependent phosphatase-like protein [Lentinula raphanica]|nr:Metallo-dependent phosphatase-like protein [Lentinula raphanica]